ncbi:MAG: aspartate carbamoyltransferase regulatory subunit [Candidatus Anstonellales archaeon]
MLKVEAIKEGTVIDHIRAGKGTKILKLLGLDEKHEGSIALLSNVKSKKLGKKDIVKIEGVFLSDEKLNLIALVSPETTINIIRDSKVVEKKSVEMPDDLRIGHCPNPSCITNNEEMHKHFKKEGEKYKCVYCERVFAPEELV